MHQRSVYSWLGNCASYMFMLLLQLLWVQRMERGFALSMWRAHRREEWTLGPPECEPAERIGFRVETLRAFVGWYRSRVSRARQNRTQTSIWSALSSWLKSQLAITYSVRRPANASSGRCAFFDRSSTQNYQRKNTHHHSNDHVLTTFLQSKYPVFGPQTPEETSRETDTARRKTEIPPQLTTAPGKNRRLDFSTAKWSVLNS
jgi:hypothetical protein